MKKQKIKIRRRWFINPVTRVKESRKSYRRSQAKKETRALIQQEYKA